jgi:hypothetical protein
MDDAPRRRRERRESERVNVKEDIFYIYERFLSSVNIVMSRVPLYTVRLCKKPGKIELNF